jgi:hypothetical protein
MEGKYARVMQLSHEPFRPRRHDRSVDLGPAYANVITDWDEKAVVVVTPMMASWGAGYPSMAQRTMAMVHTAMFDAVNPIERRYRPYLVQLPAERTTSEEAAAATAAAAILATIDPKTASEMKVALASYLGSIPDGTAKLARTCTHKAAQSA